MLTFILLISQIIYQTNAFGSYWNPFGYPLPYEEDVVGTERSKTIERIYHRDWYPRPENSHYAAPRDYVVEDYGQKRRYNEERTLRKPQKLKAGKDADDGGESTKYSKTKNSTIEKSPGTSQDGGKAAVSVAGGAKNCTDEWNHAETMGHYAENPGDKPTKEKGYKGLQALKCDGLKSDEKGDYADKKYSEKDCCNCCMGCSKAPIKGLDETVVNYGKSETEFPSYGGEAISPSGLPENDDKKKTQKRKQENSSTAGGPYETVPIPPSDIPKDVQQVHKNCKPCENWNDVCTCVNQLCKPSKGNQPSCRKTGQSYGRDTVSQPAKPRSHDKQLLNKPQSDKNEGYGIGPDSKSPTLNTEHYSTRKDYGSIPDSAFQMANQELYPCANCCCCRCCCCLDHAPIEPPKTCQGNVVKCTKPQDRVHKYEGSGSHQTMPIYDAPKKTEHGEHASSYHGPHVAGHGDGRNLYSKPQTPEYFPCKTVTEEGHSQRCNTTNLSLEGYRTGTSSKKDDQPNAGNFQHDSPDHGSSKGTRNKSEYVKKPQAAKKPYGSLDGSTKDSSEFETIKYVEMPGKPYAERKSVGSLDDSVTFESSLNDNQPIKTNEYTIDSGTPYNLKERYESSDYSSKEPIKYAYNKDFKTEDFSINSGESYVMSNRYGKFDDSSQEPSKSDKDSKTIEFLVTSGNRFGAHESHERLEDPFKYPLKYDENKDSKWVKPIFEDGEPRLVGRNFGDFEASIEDNFKTSGTPRATKQHYGNANDFAKEPEESNDFKAVEYAVKSGKPYTVGKSYRTPDDFENDELKLFDAGLFKTVEYDTKSEVPNAPRERFGGTELWEKEPHQPTDKRTAKKEYFFPLGKLYTVGDSFGSVDDSPKDLINNDDVKDIKIVEYDIRTGKPYILGERYENFVALNEEQPKHIGSSHVKTIEYDIMSGRPYVMRELDGTAPKERPEAPRTNEYIKGEYVVKHSKPYNLKERQTNTIKSTQTDASKYRKKPKSSEESVGLLNLNTITAITEEIDDIAKELNDGLHGSNEKKLNT